MLRGELIKVTAQSLGIDDLSDTCVRALLPEVELRVREIIQDAMKFRSHSKRTHLTTTHINQALQTRNIESLYGFGAPGTTTYRQCNDTPSLFFPEDEVVDVSEILNAPLPHIPMQPTLNIHWLAVDGVQPLIPENETMVDDSTARTSIKDPAFTGLIDQKPLVKHVLTEEMQLYYTKVTEAIKSDDFERQRVALSTLAKDPGIHQLLPYFSRFIYEEVKHSNHDLTLLFSLMRVCRCLLLNQNLRIELYLHQLLPAILTCILGKQLCENPADDHWSLRKYAANLIAQICQRYGETYERIQTRIAKTYHQAMTDPHCPFTTQYGALHGLMYLGPLVLENLLFPHIETYYKRLEPALASSNPNFVERLEAQNCLGILVHASGMYFTMSSNLSRTPNEGNTATNTLDVVGLLNDAFGESLVPYATSLNYTNMVELCL